MTFVSENLGQSKLAGRFGVKGYPAVFIDDVLVARPGDFGFFGLVEGKGRYAPWRDAQSQARFRVDLIRMIDVVLAGKKNQLRREIDTASNVEPLAALPKWNATDMEGRAVSDQQLAGRPVLVEFWATWCEPCRSTLQWLSNLKLKHGEKIEIVTLAVESPSDQVRTTAASAPGLHWALADDNTARAFGDITALPTMFLFDRSGKTARIFYGAPPDLHEQAEKVLNTLLN